ncbi:MAG: hypothetical protein Q7R71_00260 [bacterium]|nr:hypothetical protein [bacterium]
MKKISRRWKYKNTTILVLSLVALFFLAQTETARVLIEQIGSYGYIGATITGIFFVSTFTVAPAIVVLVGLAQILDPWILALSAGAGGAFGDFVIFRFLRDGVFEELRPFYRKYGGSHLNALGRNRIFAWMAPALGAIIIASPLPDEIGIGLMGLSKIKTWQFVCLVFVLDTLGILAIVLLARSLMI